MWKETERSSSDEGSGNQMKDRSPLFLAIRVSLIYLLVAGLWIVFSDRLLDYFITDHSMNLIMQTVKGWFFVITTGVLLFVERKFANEAMHRSEMKFRQYLDFSIEGILLAASNGRVIVWNTSMEQITGFSCAEAMGKRFDDIGITGLSLPAAVDAAGLSETQSDSDNVREIVVCGAVKQIETIFFPVTSGRERLIGGIFRDVTKRRKMEQSLKNSLAEKETLLKEIHHRVKNNLQMITSLLSIQERAIKDEESLTAFKESRNRIYSIALIHENLYRQDNLSLIGIANYVRHMSAGLAGLYSKKGRTVSIRQEIPQGLMFRIDTAIPFGLLLNELLTNAIKYAVPDDSPEITVTLVDEGGSVTLKVRDNGQGLPDGTDTEGSSSIGMNLIANLSRQLGGKPVFSNDNGAVFILNFKPQ